jgi:hypothetical protein
LHPPHDRRPDSLPVGFDGGWIESDALIGHEYLDVIAGALSENRHSLGSRVPGGVGDCFTSCLDERSGPFGEFSISTDEYDLDRGVVLVFDAAGVVTDGRMEFARGSAGSVEPGS